MEPFFSIIIPTYNRAGFIGKTVESVLQQKFEDFEVVIVDDGSTDDTETLMRRIEDLRVHYFKKENEERGAARNFGIERSKGKFVTFVDSDDVLYSNYFSNAYESLNNLGFPPFFHLAYEVKTIEGKVLRRIDNLSSDDITMFAKGNPLSCMGVFIERGVTREFRFNEERKLAGSEDWELWLRIAANYGIKTDNRISAALIDHTSRSVLGYSESELSVRKQLALEFAFKDRAVREKFSSYRNIINSYSNSYISLHLALSGKTRSSISFLLKALFEYPLFVSDRRFFAIIKYLLTSLK